MQSTRIGRQKDCWLLTVQHENTGEVKTFTTPVHPVEWLNDALVDHAERFVVLCALPISRKQFDLTERLQHP